MTKGQKFVLGAQKIGVVTALLLLMLASCDRSFTVKFVVPVGFHGLIRLRVSDKGQIISKTNGTYVFMVPANGYLEVRSRFPLREWHRTEAVWSDGEFLPVDAKQGMAFHNLTTDAEGNDYFYVGSLEEANNVRRSASKNSILGRVEGRK